MDMPRMSRSRSVADAALANRIHARYDARQSRTGRPACPQGRSPGTMNSASTQAVARAWLNRCLATRPVSLLRRRLQKGNELRRDASLRPLRSSPPRARSCRASPSRLGSTKGGGLNTDMICATIASRDGNRVSS